MDILRVNPLTDPIWQQLIDTHPHSSLFHSPVWIGVLNETYGFETEAYVQVDAAGRPVAGIPFCRILDIRGQRIVSLPFSDFCDPLVETQEQWEALTAAPMAEKSQVVVRCLHNDVPLQDKRFQVVKQAMWHGKDLEADIDTLWEGLEASARRAVRKAEREGVTVRIASDKEGLREFFRLHFQIRKYKYGLLAQPYRFFENLWDRLLAAQQGALMLAEYQGQVIASVMFLEWQDTLVYKFSASDQNFLNQRGTDLLIWEGIRYGQSRGRKRLDFGLSDLDQDGLIRYKRKYSSEEKLISFLSHTPAEEMATVPQQQARELLPGLTRLFTDESVPDSLTEQAGDMLYRFFA